MGIAAVRAALIVAAVMAFFHALPASSGQARAYGRELVAEYQIPAEALTRVATGAQGGSDGAGEQAGSDDRWLWTGPSQQVGTGRNPYTLVLTVVGVARQAGESRSRWQAGWQVHESPVATREVLMPLTGVAGTRVAAGALVTLTASGSVVSFRGERQAAPILNFVGTHNLDISELRLQVWSGAAPAAWSAWSLWRPGLILLALLCALAWFALRGTPRDTARTVVPRPAPSPSTEPDLHALLEPPGDSRPQPSPAAPAPTPEQPNHALHVMAALRDVLTHGLVVPATLDERQASKAR